MSRDLTPKELLALEKEMLQQSGFSLADFMNYTTVSINGKESPMYSAEELAHREQYPLIGKLMNNFEDMYHVLAKKSGGVDILRQYEAELTDYIAGAKGIDDSLIVQWFEGRLDPHFYYFERNEECLISRILTEAEALEQTQSSFGKNEEFKDGCIEPTENISKPVITAELCIDQEEIGFIKQLLSMTGPEIYEKYGLKRDETITKTLHFQDGCELDVKVVICEEDEPYIDFVLFDKNGSEIACDIGDNDTIEGEVTFETEKAIYIGAIRGKSREEVVPPLDDVIDNAAQRSEDRNYSNPYPEKDFNPTR